jgi:uncharacterized surface protein with fasciclin (FAS1) repeats
LSGCGSDSTTAAPAPTTTTASCQSIPALASSVANLSTLVGLLTNHSLVDALSAPGPFTVFAPTNAAFDAASSVIATLTYDQITDVLLYHVVGNTSAMAADLTVDEKLATLFAPHDLTVATIAPTVTIQPDGTGAADATVTGPNNVACNGVVHIIDAVLVPDLTAPTPTPGNATTTAPATTTAAATMNIVELAQSVPSLSTLVTLLVQQNLTDVLSGPGPFTVFAPNDDAFTAAADITATLTSGQLTEVLTYHVVGAEALAADLTKDESLTTLFTPHDLTVATIAPNVTIHPDGGADATVITPNVMATNGVVHVVNAVLVPALSAASYNLQVV